MGKNENIFKEYEELVQSKKILNEIKKEWTNLEKALYVYIELEKRLNNIDSRDVALIYKTLMDILEIPCKIINGIKENAWNEIEIDGKFYPLDLSWDCDYYHSKESQGKIGICRFLTDKSFYRNPNHYSQEVPLKDKMKIRALDPELVKEALNVIVGKEYVEEILEVPEIDLKSKELKGIFKDDKLSEESISDIEQVKIRLSDNDIDGLKSDIEKIARYYPRLLRNVEIENTSANPINMQEVVDSIYTAKETLNKTEEASRPINITISSDKAEDFNLDFSKAPVFSNHSSHQVDSALMGQSVILKNTGTNAIEFPDIMSKFSQNITGLTIDGFNIKKLDLKPTNIRKITFRSPLTTIDNGITGLPGIGKVVVDNISDLQFEVFMTTMYPANPNIFNLTISNQNLHNRNVIDELANNSNLTMLSIINSKLNNVNGLERFNGRLGYLFLDNNNIALDDIKKINEFNKNTSNAIISCINNPSITNEIRSVINQISHESKDFIRNQLESCGDAYNLYGSSYNTVINSDNSNIVQALYHEYGTNIPYYIKDAQIMRNTLNLTNNPMMLEDDNEINTVNFDEDYIKEGKLLLTISQFESLLQAGRRVPQEVFLRIEKITDIDSNQIKNLNRRAKGLGINLAGVQIFDKNNDNNYTEIAPYSLSEYVYIRDTLDIIVDGINSSESDLDKFTTVYLRLANSIVYDDDALNQRNRQEALYMIKTMNTDRNLLNGLRDGKCVCAGYADILRNALDLVGVECRKNGGRCHASDPKTGHAWNQVKIDGKWYYTDLTWDSQKNTLNNGNYPNMLRGKNSFIHKHQLTRNPHIENVEDEDYDDIKLKDAINRAKARNFDFTKGRDPIDIPSDPHMTLQLDDDRIRDEFKRRTDDMFAKYYGDKDYQREYEERSVRHRNHEIEMSQAGIIYRTIEDYTEKEDDERFLMLDKYKECLERMTKYEAGVTNVYSGTPNQIDAQYQSDREYVQTRNHTFNQHEYTQRDLATLGKFGERVPYIPQQQGVIRNIGRAIGNTGIFFRNTLYAPMHRLVGRFIAQPIHRLVTRRRDASPYRNNIYHRMVARRNYFLEQAQMRDEQETQDRISRAVNPANVRPVRHTIRNYFSSRANAIFRARSGNEAVLRAGAADIKENIKAQETQKAMIQTLQNQIQEYRTQINALNQELTTRPHAINKNDVTVAINAKIARMNALDQRLARITIDASSQTDAISSEQHAIASKEVNTLRTTVIKGFAKGLAVKYVGPKIQDWLLQRGRQIKTYDVPTQEVQESKVWVPTTYKEKVTDVYDTVLDTEKSMKDIIVANKGKEITGFYSVYGGENKPDIYQLVGNEKITAVFQSVGKGGKGLSDTVGLQAPTLTDGTFSKNLLDASGLLKQNTTIDQLIKGISNGTIDAASLDNVYVSIGDRYWTKLSDLTQDLVKQVKVDQITQQVVDVAGHYESVKNVINKTRKVQKVVMNPTIQKGVRVGTNIAKGAVAVDTLVDVVENIRPTTTDVRNNKKQPRKYDYNDNDLDNIPTSRKDYQESR